MKFEGKRLIDLQRIAAYGQSFKHCWISGATLIFEGNCMLFANEMRTSLLLYQSIDGAEYDKCAVSVNYIPPRAGDLEITPIGSDIRIKWGQTMGGRELTVKQSKNVADAIREIFAKYAPESHTQEMVEISNEIFSSVISKVMNITIELKEGNLLFGQTSPAGDITVQNKFDAQAAREGSILEFMPLELPKYNRKVMVPTDEFINLGHLSDSIAFYIQDEDKPLIGTLHMLAGEAMFIISPSKYREDEVTTPKVGKPSEDHVGH